MLPSELDYPLEPHIILVKQKAIKRQLLEQNMPLLPKKVAILGGENTKNLSDILELFLLARGIEPVFYESEFNRFYEDSVFGGVGIAGAPLDEFAPDFIYLHTTHRNIRTFPDVDDSEEQVSAKVASAIKHFREVWTGLERFNCPVIQNNFDLPTTRPLGNLDFYDCRGKTHFINRLNGLMAQEANSRADLFINDINYLSAQMGLNNWFDKKLWYSASQSISVMAFPRLSQNLASIMSAILGISKKCLVLDLDGTCWGGVIADDGIENIALGENGSEGQVYQEFQTYVKALNQRGVILAVCSKNESDNAEVGFNHPGSVLGLDDFSCFKANWQPKDENIQQIASEVNIGLDTCVFMDDSHFERQLVMDNLAPVQVPDLSTGVMEYVNHLDQNGYFEPVSLNKEDLQRREYYQQNKAREQLKKKHHSLDAYLQSLEMKGRFSAFTPINFDRIFQLINKTNQFNLTTKRVTKSQVEEIYDSGEYIAMSGSLKDIYGDNGIVSVMVGHIEGQTCSIKIWVMSCRVFHRGFEYAFFDHFVAACKKRGITTIVGNYIPSNKNSIVKDLYLELGARLMENDPIENGTSASVWEIQLDSYKTKNKWITHE